MLILSRRNHESIVLAGNISIHILGIEGDRVKLGVDAPPDVIVLRSELVPTQQSSAFTLAAGDVAMLQAGQPTFHGLHLVTESSLLLDED